jgi:serine/threonine-protein kinase
MGEVESSLVGTIVLGVYEIVSVLGHGGMSVVYKARHKMTDQLVALKILPAELAANTTLKARFLEEAKALARLEHPNIVHLYNFGEERGRFVLAMQYVEGGTFEQRIAERGRLPWREAVRLCVEVLSALEFAHGRGVVHRDIKPSNILVRQNGSATVMDFGIAKIAAESSRLTATGQTMGTVRYMSPEQVRGQVVDARSDLYSLGIALYEALAGDTPFDGSTHFEIMSKHLTDQPAPLSGRGLPEALSEAIGKSLRKDPAARFQDAMAFRTALEGTLTAEDVAPASVGEEAGTGALSSLGDATLERPARAALTEIALVPLSRRKPGLWLGIGVLALASVVAVVLGLRQRETPRASASAKAGAPVARAPSPLWPPPFVLPQMTFATDQRFDAPRSVRVLAVQAVDAAAVADAYQAARARFAAFVISRGDRRAAELHPMNLVVAPPGTLCDARLFAPDPPPPDCAELSYRYQPVERTLYLGEGYVPLDLVEGAAVHVCRTTPVLHKAGCLRLLEPFFEEVERASDESTAAREPARSAGAP